MKPVACRQHPLPCVFLSGRCPITSEKTVFRPFFSEGLVRQAEVITCGHLDCDRGNEDIEDSVGATCGLRPSVVEGVSLSAMVFVCTVQRFSDTVTLLTVGARVKLSR